MNPISLHLDMCKHIQDFWKRIIDTIYNIIHKEIPVCLRSCFLGRVPEAIDLRTHESKLVVSKASFCETLEECLLSICELLD